MSGSAGAGAGVDTGADALADAGGFGLEALADALHGLIGPLTGRRLCVAFSGGLDSSVLLDALARLRLRRAQRFELRALHVDHHLHPDSSRWARSAAVAARRLRVRFESIDAPVTRAPGESPEAAAREVRYAALAARLSAGELLLTAHHADDQLETVLLALLRGSGVRGLAAMGGVTPWRGTLLVRPLLPFTRAMLEGYARARALSWSEDPSNREQRYDRNYLRGEVLPALRRRWPAAAVTVARSAAHLAEARALLAERAEADLAPARDGAALRISVLARLPERRRRNALRQWFAERELPPPDQRRLREIAGPLLRSRPDALPSVRWRGALVRRHTDRLFAGPPAPPLLPEPLAWNWRSERWLALPGGAAIGLAPEAHGNVQLARLPARLRVHFRGGGERLGQGPSRALKTLLQAEGLAPWERAAVPLISDGDRIIAVADLWLDPAYGGESAAAPTARGARGHAARGHAVRGRFRWRRSEQLE